MSSDEQFNERPRNGPTVNELVHYMLQVEIFGMSKLGSYSGKHCEMTPVSLVIV